MWADAWSGSGGSFVAAFFGGVVALLVVLLTNEQQKREAAKGRQIAAIGDLVSALDEMVRISLAMSRSDLEDSVNRLQGAAARLHMNLPKGPLRTELRRSIPSLHTFAERPDDAAEFSAAVGVFRYELMKWPSASRKEKVQIAEKLAATRSEYESAWRALPVPKLEGRLARLRNRLKFRS
jgi:hypothetical protein